MYPHQKNRYLFLLPVGFVLTMEYFKHRVRKKSPRAHSCLYPTVFSTWPSFFHPSPCRWIILKQISNMILFHVLNCVPSRACTYERQEDISIKHSLVCVVLFTLQLHLLPSCLGAPETWARQKCIYEENRIHSKYLRQREFNTENLVK